jgi:lipid A ethanolaminephosphotransferase
MALKLFRSTGYSSILMAGETTRLAMHPGWMILAVSVWAGFVCNVVLWRQLGGTGQPAGMGPAIALGLSIAGACGLVLSLLGWRKTIKPAATLILFIAASTACSIWSAALPVDGTLLGRGLANLVLPSWDSLLRWQVSALLAVLALVPMVWVWTTPLRRLPGPRQLSVNITGSLLGAAVLGAGSWLLLHGPF